MKVGQFVPTFLGGQKCLTLFHTENEESHKKIARIYVYTHAYTQMCDGGDRSAPPALIGLSFIIAGELQCVPNIHPRECIENYCPLGNTPPRGSKGCIGKYSISSMLQVNIKRTSDEQ